MPARSRPCATSTASTPPRLGMTRHGLHRTTHPLAEARVLYELGAHGTQETTRLREALQIDAGQLSRLLNAPPGRRAGRAPALPRGRPPPAGRPHAAGERGVPHARPGLAGGGRSAAGRASRPARRARRDAPPAGRDRAHARHGRSATSRSATSAGWSSATACSTPASTAGTTRSSGSSPASPPTSTRAATAAGSRRRRRARRRRPVRARHPRDREAAHAVGRAEGTRPRPRVQAGRRSDPARDARAATAR